MGRLDLLLSIFFCSLFNYSIGQATNQSYADIFWATQPAEPNFVFPQSDTSISVEEQKVQEVKWRIERNRVMQKYYLSYREWGIQFWTKFPEDKRRYSWLIKTIGDFPLYFEDLDDGVRDMATDQYGSRFDKSSLNKWKQQYGSFKSDFMESTEVVEIFRHQLEYNEMTSELYMMRWAEIRENTKFDYRSFADKIIKYSKWYYKYNQAYLASKSNPDFPNKIDAIRINLIEKIIKTAQFLNLTFEDLEIFLEILIKANIQELSENADKCLALVKLYKTPFELSAKSIDGQSVNLKNMRGKVVLIDFWSIWCTSCIKLMPELKLVYDRFKEKGFEVISVDMTSGGKDYENKAIKIYKKIGASWPLLRIGGSYKNKLEGLGKKIWDTYGFHGVPQVLLFDKSGKLVVYNSVLLTGDLSSTVEKYIAE